MDLWPERAPLHHAAANPTRGFFAVLCAIADGAPQVSGLVPDQSYQHDPAECTFPRQVEEIRRGRQIKHFFAFACSQSWTSRGLGGSKTNRCLCSLRSSLGDKGE